MRAHQPTQKRNVLYRVYPQAICESYHVKKVLYRLKHENMVLSDSTRNTRINFVTTRKTPTSIKDKGNVIVSGTCTCKRKKKFVNTKFNETGRIAANRILTTFSECDGPRHAFREVQYHNGLAYKSQTKHLVRYIEYKNRKFAYDRLGLPNYSFVKLLGKSGKRLKHRKRNAS